MNELITKKNYKIKFKLHHLTQINFSQKKKKNENKSNKATERSSTPVPDFQLPNQTVKPCPNCVV